MSQAGLEQFWQLVLRDPALREQLGEAPDGETFLALALQLGVEQGYSFAHADVEASLHAGRQTWLQRPMQLEASQLAGWTPIRLSWQHSRAVVDWCYQGTLRFSAPFFDQTISKCLSRPFNWLFRHQTGIDVLAELQAAQPRVPPTGFIFHMSRCGSTLISQMLATLPQNIVVSEADPIDAVLRANVQEAHITDDERVAWLQWMASVLGQRRHEEERHFFIKFDSWNTLDLPLIRRAFPHVPWIFVYRDPVEVMVSHRRMRGSQMVPGMIAPGLFGLDVAAANQMPLDVYCARVLACICDAAVQHRRRDQGMVIHYRQLPEAVWSSLLDFFRVTHTAADIDRMRCVARFHAKNPSLPFVDDTSAKNQEATDLVRELAEQWVGRYYTQLEAMRHAQGARA